MNTVKVLIVDDSVVFRSQIRAALDATSWIQVVGASANGRLALEKLKSNPVDLIILDLEMPEMNGIETLKELKILGLKTKVIVFSAISKRGAQITLEALDLGATDFVTKPDGTLNSGNSIGASDTLRNLLLPKIEGLFQTQMVAAKSEKRKLVRPLANLKPNAILIGSSTGGPTALEKIFSGLKGPFACPVLIVQHMPPVFTASLAQRISKLCGVPAGEGVDGEKVENNRIYIAPGNFHMQVIEKDGAPHISLNQQEQECSVRPAVDQLFRTAAKTYPLNCVAFVLTGMGKDGFEGALKLRESGNPIIIQNKESCVVFGMPGALFEASAYDDIQDLEEITATLKGFLQVSQVKKIGVA
jgi:two-component system, chemotaxis family, protein-glutamate methylesterase/glutaminase